MIFRLRVILDNDTKEDILRDVELDKNSNLTDLHELILLSFNFSADQMASFYTVDEDWNQINEISLMNFDESTDSMESTLIADVLNNQNTKLLYIYDFMNMWTFYVELIEEAQEINDIKISSCKSVRFEFLSISTSLRMSSFVSLSRIILSL